MKVVDILPTFCYFFFFLQRGTKLLEVWHHF